MRDKLYKYFKHKNTYRYVDVLSDFVSVYNATVHVSTGMAPANVKDSEILELWKRMQKIRGKVRVKDARYSVGQHVRISKGKAKSAKVGRTKFQYGDLSNYQSGTQDPAPVYELEDLNRKVIEGQFYEEELTPVRLTKQTQFQIDKILATRRRRGIKQHLVRRMGYKKDFDSCIPASDIQKI